MGTERTQTRVAVLGVSSSLGALYRSLSKDETLAVRRGIDVRALDAGVDVVLLELAPDDDPGHRLAEVRELSAAPVVVLAAATTASLVSSAVDAGVADVLVQPYDAGSVLFAIEKAVRAARAGSGSESRVVTVFSPKGGTGKSVVSSNLAAALARRGGRRTLLVDLDLQFGDAAIMLGLRPGRTFRELVASPAELDAETLEVYTDRHRSGLELLAAPLHPEEAELVSESAVRNVLGIARATHDAVVVDTPPFFNATTLASLDTTDELLVVCTPDIATVKNVRLALETLSQISLPAQIRVILNRYGDVGGLRADDVAEALERELDFLIPFDPAVPIGVNRGVPAVLDSHGEFATAIGGLARGLFPEERPATTPSRKSVPLRRRFAFARS